MKGKLLLLSGAAAGYVLGTRAGRQRYDQIRARVDAIWRDPKVQQKVTDAQETVKEKAPEIQHKMADAASTVADKARSTVRRDHEPDDMEIHARNGHVPRAR